MPTFRGAIQFFAETGDTEPESPVGAKENRRTSATISAA